MTRILNKIIEKRQIERFISQIGSNYMFTKLESTETPDFIAHTPNEKIAIEHTRFIDPTNKQIEKFRKEVIDEAQKRFENEIGVNLDVTFHYSNTTMDKNQPKSYYINLLYNLVNEIYQVNKNREFRVSTHRLKIENKYINKVTVRSETEKSIWQSIGAYLVQPVHFQQVQKVIDEKSQLINNYKIITEKKWLVIIAGIGYKSSGYRFDLLDNKLLSKQNFDSIFFFDDRAEEIIELK